MVLMCLAASQAVADSCWSYEGALLRLQQEGHVQSLVVKDPGDSRTDGLEAGMVLFRGIKEGAWYGGWVYDYHASCLANPPIFDVEGPVLQGPLRIELEGRHLVYEACEPTEEWRQEVLIITYVGVCDR